MHGPTSGPWESLMFCFLFVYFFVSVPNNLWKSGCSLIQYLLMEFTCHRTTQALYISWQFLYPSYGWEVQETSSRSSVCLPCKVLLPPASQLPWPSAIIFTHWMKQRPEDPSMFCYVELHIFKECHLFRWLYSFFSIHSAHLTLVYAGYLIALYLCIFCALSETNEM